MQTYHANGGLASFEYFLRSLKNIPAPNLTSHVLPVVEIAAGALIICGLLTRVIALVLAVEMAVTGFVVKLFDLHTAVVSPVTAGAELDIVYLVLLLVLFSVGPGRISADMVVRLEGQPRDPARQSASPRRAVHRWPGR